MKRVELTTVADDFVVFHDGATTTRVHDLQPATTYTLLGVDVTTLARPPGELLCRFATVNDLHFGETEAGRIGNHREGPIQRREPGEPPYPETMNRAAAGEMSAIDPAAVVVKGDLTNDGLPEEFAAFDACYVDEFGDRLHVVRGNHDSYRKQSTYTGDQWLELPGIAVALIDTAIPEHTTGNVSDDQLEWLDEHLARSDRPTIVMGHHQQWISGNRSASYFGIRPDASEALSNTIAQRPNAIAYTAGHTHRHRIRAMACGVPSIEVGCVKDFPGVWAEYRVYEGGVTQVVHRISDPAALAWSERCRHLYSDFGLDYQSYAMGRLEDRCCNIPLR